MLSFPKMELSNERVARGARPIGGENLFFARKITNDPKCSNFFEICAGFDLFSIMLLQRSLSQDVEGVGPFPLFLCFGQPSLDHFHSCLAYVHPRPIMIFHVPEQVLILVGLGQQPLQMSIDPEKHSLSLSGYQIAGSLSSQVAVLMNPPQLIKSVLILKLLVALL